MVFHHGWSFKNEKKNLRKIFEKIKSKLAENTCSFIIQTQYFKQNSEIR